MTRPRVASMLPVTATPTSVSARKVLLEMATSCVCPPFYLQSVHQGVAVTVTVSTMFPTSVSVTPGLVAIHTRPVPPPLM